MARRPQPASGDSSALAVPVLHLAARLEDRLHAFRERRARKRGHTPTVIPYMGYGSPGWVRVLARVLLTKPSSDGASRYKKIRGWRSFTSVPVDDVVVTIRIGSVEARVTADRGGVVDARVQVDLAPGWHSVTLSAENADSVEAPVHIIDPASTIGIISDIDDTVMVTALPRPLLAAWNTFVLDEHARSPVPGMAVLYERFSRQHPGAPVFYLSTGAWNVAPTLTRFLSRNLYPAGPLLLTDWGPTHDRWFRSGKLHKQDSLNRLAEEFPDIRWLLVGDDGQHDEELYAHFSSAHDGVAAVAIRQLSSGEAVLAGGRSKAEDHNRGGGPPWVYAPDGAGIAEQLARLGLLETPDIR
jgi:phosphatidate phosphatase APP1